jgi:hypothetical protein
MKAKKAAEKELVVHMKDVKQARSKLTKDAGKLKKDINKDITHALKQDKIIQKDVKKVKCK